MLRRGLWLLLLALSIAGGIQASVMADEWREEGGRSRPQIPEPIGPTQEEVDEPETLPGRDNPEEFYRPPPRPPKKLFELPA